VSGHPAADAVHRRRLRIRDSLSTLPARLMAGIDSFEPFPLVGRVRKVVGTIIHAVVPKVEIGGIVELATPGGGARILAEVVGFLNEEALLSPIGEIQGIAPNTEVRPTGRVQEVRVGDGLLGRVLDGMGQCIDGGPEPQLPPVRYPVYQMPPDPMKRQVIMQPLSLGVRAIDALLTCGEGQRMGVFAAAGGGKSTLLSMFVKGAAVDVTVVALIGERGREVREFIEKDLGRDGMERAVVVVATSDRSAMERVKAAYVATAIAEYFRDQGRKVLFLMDSVTRFARALREIGLAAGEPPTRRGFPPSVFSSLPKLMERAGTNDKGSITALYTVLVEGDDMTEPVADETRSILDGHIVLSRELAEANHYPAIDILKSKSRVMDAIVPQSHQRLAGRLRSLMAKYGDVELLVRIGEYQKGSDPEADLAIGKHAAINAFLRQGVDERVAYATSIEQLEALIR
jgi:type III secretion protein N (ATPase)